MILVIDIDHFRDPPGTTSSFSFFENGLVDVISNSEVIGYILPLDFSIIYWYKVLSFKSKSMLNEAWKERTLCFWKNNIFSNQK